MVLLKTNPQKATSLNKELKLYMYLLINIVDLSLQLSSDNPLFCQAMPKGNN